MTVTIATTLLNDSCTDGVERSSFVLHEQGVVAKRRMFVHFSNQPQRKANKSISPPLPRHDLECQEADFKREKTEEKKKGQMQNLIL